MYHCAQLFLYFKRIFHPLSVQSPVIATSCYTKPSLLKSLCNFFLLIRDPDEYTQVNETWLQQGIETQDPEMFFVFCFLLPFHRGELSIKGRHLLGRVLLVLRLHLPTLHTWVHVHLLEPGFLGLRVFLAISASVAGRATVRTDTVGEQLQPVTTRRGMSTPPPHQPPCSLGWESAGHTFLRVCFCKQGTNPSHTARWWGSRKPSSPAQYTRFYTRCCLAPYAQQVLL